MKKRLGAIVALILLLVTMTTSFCFAGTLELVDSYPRDGDKGMQVENSGVKLYFNQNMINKDHEKGNVDSFKFTDAKGKVIPTRVLYSPKEKGLVLVLVDNKMLESNSEYKLSISKDVMAKSGDTLAKDLTIQFKTVDTGTSMKINMVMMGVMMVGVIWASSKSAKKQEEKAKADAAADSKVNPYKVAKETGKSVEEIVAKEKRDKERKQRKLERKIAKQNGEILDDDDEDDDDDGNKHVKVPRRISEGGSTYITGRKAAAEEAARKRAQAGTTKPKNKPKKKK